MKKGWTYKKLGECFISINNGANIKQVKGAKGFPITRIETLSNDVFNRDRMGYADIEELTPYSSYVLNDGDILMSHINSMKFLGRAVEYTKKGEEKVIHGMNLLRLIPSDGVLSSFMVYQFQTSFFRNQIALISHQSVNQASFNTTNLKGLDLILPSLSEQKRIVKRLDAAFAQIDELNANAEKQLAEARALFQKSLAKAMEPKEGWEEMKLGEFAYMKAGDFVKASDIHKDYSEGLYPCYGGNGLRGYVKEPNQDGDFCLIGRQGALCGCINRASGVFRTTEHAVIVKPYKEIPTSLVFYLLTNLNLNKYATGAAQPGLSVNNIAEVVRISVPPAKDYQHIVERLDSISENVRKYEEIKQKIIAECDALKQALLRQVFE